MEFPREELLEKYVRIYEQFIAPYKPDFEVAGGTTPFDTTQNGDVTYELHDFEWYEYDDAGRLISEERFRGSGSPNDDVVIDSEYYEYDGDILSHAWQFTEFEKYPMELTRNLVMSWFPDRIICPQKFEFIFERVADGLDYTRNHYFRKSQTMTYKDHVSEETLTHLAENGIRLV